MSSTETQTQTHYDVLEVPETASPAEIKKAYRRLSLIHHPDKNRGNTDVSGKFQKITEAYEILSDEHKRQEYDFGRKMSPFGQGGAPFGPREVDEFFNNLFFGGQMRGAGPNIKIFRSNPMSFGGGGPMNFGGGPMNFGGGPMNFNNMFTNVVEKPSPIMSNIEINMEQVLNGGTVPIEIERWLMEHNNRVYETETLYVSIPKLCSKTRGMLRQMSAEEMSKCLSR
jgi:molecular chaperone DnaJ